MVSADFTGRPETGPPRCRSATSRPKRPDAYFLILTNLSLSVQSLVVSSSYFATRLAGVKPAQSDGAPDDIFEEIIMKTLTTTIALTAILATSAVAKTERTRPAHIRVNNVVSHDNSVSSAPGVPG